MTIRPKTAVVMPKGSPTTEPDKLVRDEDSDNPEAARASWTRAEVREAEARLERFARLRARSEQGGALDPEAAAWLDGYDKALR